MNKNIWISAGRAARFAAGCATAGTRRSPASPHRAARACSRARPPRAGARAAPRRAGSAEARAGEAQAGRREGHLRRRRAVRLRQVGDQARRQVEARRPRDKVKAINLEVVIAIGHADSIGSDAYNQRLSVRRAEAVKAYLVSQGRRAEPHLHRGQGREAAGREQQDRRRPRQEPPRGDRSHRHAQVTDRSRADKKAPLRRGFLFARMRPWCNADPAELEKFSQLAHRWWDPQGEFRPLHEINPLRLDWIDGHAPLAGKRGARRRLRRRHPRRGDGAPRRARSPASTCPRRRSRSPSCTCTRAGCEVDYEASAPKHSPSATPARSTSSPAWSCSSTCRSRPSMVAACARLVRPGGQVFFSTINRNPKSYLFAVLGAEYVLKLLPKGTHDYRALHQALRARALVPRRRAARRGADRHDLQPAHAALPPRQRLRRQLPAALRA